MSSGGQGTKRRRSIAENFNRLSRVHERYRQTRQTDGRTTTYSEREPELTFANKMLLHKLRLYRLNESVVNWITSFLCNRQQRVTRNSSGDEIANVNFLYDDIVHVLQNTMTRA